MVLFLFACSNPSGTDGKNPEVRVDTGTMGDGDVSYPMDGLVDIGLRDAHRSGVDQGRRDAGRDVSVDPIDCGDDTLCGRGCTDLLSDLRNCGGCGRTCIVPNAVPICVEGRCAIEACEAPFIDQDSDPDNGCEFENSCMPGQRCATACLTTGTIRCEAGDEICEPPEESCNAVDDDCDDQCDEGQVAGCRAGVHRAYGPNGHIYSNDLDFIGTGGFNVEARNYFYLYTEPYGGMRPVQLCPKGGGSFFLSSDNACEIGRAPVAVLGFWSPEPLCGSIPLYRLRQPTSDNHFYTTNANERDNAINNLGYISEGIGGHVWPHP